MAALFGVLPNGRVLLLLLLPSAGGVVGDRQSFGDQLLAQEAAHLFFHTLGLVCTLELLVGVGGDCDVGQLLFAVGESHLRLAQRLKVILILVLKSIRLLITEGLVVYIRCFYVTKLILISGGQ
jgi:hypothetical protein